ncbi:helix-turn-helix domain-containing protein [Tropicibacter alexandrii]|uniref:AraC-like ligand-binding domain-containing protein n=1 Tax=Tropicibacter alexandrii TaxID=2267683 RepID=UPI0013E8CDED|nr:helix-turn-helix domain-containing protein [Tropicibacter alexandrii]
MAETASYSTSSVAARDRIAYWSEAVCDTFVQLGCDAPRTAPFSGSLRTTRHSSLTLSEVDGASHSVARRKRDILRADGEYFLLSLQCENTCALTQFDNRVLLKPGDMGLYDSAHPYLLELSQGFSQTVLQLPKQRLLERLPMARMMGGTRIDGQSALGRLVRENTLAISGHLASSDGAVAALLQETLIDLIATGLAASRGAEAELALPQQHAIMRARAFIAENIGDPDLDRTRVAAEVGLSVRRLNSIFAEAGSSIAEEIRRKRLDTVAAALRDPRFASLSISEIAMQCGFNNLQHFSTVFRGAYGVSPRAFRKRAEG